MSDHGAEHEERLIILVWGDGSEDVAAIATAATECEECFAYLFRLAEDEAALGGASERLARALDEAIAWRAVREDALAPAPVPTGGPRRTK